MEITTHTPGSFCTAVLRTRDMERAAGFYGALMGWTTEDMSLSPRHSLLQFGGKTVASLHQIDSGNDLWVPQASVEDIEKTTADALALGATLMDTADIPGLARLATLHDEEGAVFGLWQPSPHQGAQLTEVVGSLWWIEVLSDDVAGARNFYERLFGWSSRETSFEPFESYTVFKRGEIQEGGLLPIGKDWEVSPRWNSIFNVGNCDATVEQAQALGGCPVFVHTVPNAGRIGSLSDPGGATFVIRGPVS
jgi:predicted enzyme related to lactoylglutathione lyase